MTCWASGSSRWNASPTNASTTLSGSRSVSVEQFGQGGVAIGGQDRRQRLQRPRIAPGPLPRPAQLLVRGGLEAQPTVRVPGPQQLLGVRRRQPLIQVDAPLPAGLVQQQRLRRHPGGDDDLHRVRRRRQQRPQRLVQRPSVIAPVAGSRRSSKLSSSTTTGRRAGTPPAARASTRSGSRADPGTAASTARAVSSGSSRHRSVNRFGEAHRVRARRCAGRRCRPPPARLPSSSGSRPVSSALQQPAHHRGLADPAAPHHRHQPGILGRRNLANHSVSTCRS